MNGFAAAVRAKLVPSCVVDGIDNTESRCGLSLANAPDERVIADLDRCGAPLGHARVKCDFLFFGDPGFVAPIEIKDQGAPNITKAAKQLQAGADAADGLAPRDVAVRFRPVLLSRNLRRDKQNELRRARVRFRNRPAIVRQLICGDSLAEALGSS